MDSEEFRRQHRRRKYLIELGIDLMIEGGAQPIRSAYKQMIMDGDKGFYKGVVINEGDSILLLRKEFIRELKNEEIKSEENGNSKQST